MRVASYTCVDLSDDDFGAGLDFTGVSWAAETSDVFD